MAADSVSGWSAERIVLVSIFLFGLFAILILANQFQMNREIDKISASLTSRWPVPEVSSTGGAFDEKPPNWDRACNCGDCSNVGESCTYTDSVNQKWVGSCTQDSGTCSAGEGGGAVKCTCSRVG